MAIALAGVPLEVPVWFLLGDSRALGMAALIAVGAVIVGFLVRRAWPKTLNPGLFGALAATGVVAGLAALGVPTAGLVLWLFIAGAVVLTILAFVFN